MLGPVVVAVLYAVVPICCILIGFGIIRRDYKDTLPSTEATSQQHRADKEYH